MYDTLYAVLEGTVTDFPFLRSREDWRVCQVLRHLAVRKIPPVVGEKANFSWDYYPESPPKSEEINRGVYVPGALGEWTIRTSLRVLTLYEQREVRDVPVVRRKALYPTTPVWWEHVEVPRGMAARVPQMVALQGSQLMGEPLGGPYHLMLAALWAVEVADVFLGSIRHHGHLWRLPMAIRSAFADLTPERLCSADPSAQPLLEAGLKLLRLIEEQAPANRLSWLGGPRGVFRCAKALDDEGTLVLQEGLGDARLPYGRRFRADTRIRALDRDLADAGSARTGLVVAPEPPSAPAASASAPLALLPPSWGRVSRPACVSRLASRPERPRRAYLLGGSGGTTATLGGPPGPPLAPLPLFTWEGSAQFGTPSPVNTDIWLSWGVPLGNSRPSLITGWTIRSSWRLAAPWCGCATRLPPLFPAPLGNGTSCLFNNWVRSRRSAVIYRRSMALPWWIPTQWWPDGRSGTWPPRRLRPEGWLCRRRLGVRRLHPHPIMGRAPVLLLTPTMGRAPVLSPRPPMGRAPVLLPKPPMGRAPVLPLKPYMGLGLVSWRIRRRTRGRITMHPNPSRIAARTMILAMGPVLGVGELVTLG